MVLVRLLVLAVAAAFLGACSQAAAVPTGPPQKVLVMAPTQQSVRAVPLPQDPATAQQPAAPAPQSPLEPANAPAPPASALSLPGSCSGGGRPPRVCPPS
jgi:hypothetical protein